MFVLLTKMIIMNSWLIDLIIIMIIIMIINHRNQFQFVK